MANANVDAEKLVFAVDLVKFFVKKHYPHIEFQLGTNIANAVDNYRPHVPQHFNENLQKIIDDIDETQNFIVQRDFLEIKHNKGGISLSSLMEYIDSFKKCNLAGRFTAGNFLMFCARVSLMSCFFFLSATKCELDYVIDIIKASFPDNEDECRLLWNAIDKAAENYDNNLQEDSASAVFGREPGEPVDSNSGVMEDTSKSDTQGKSASALLGREAGISANLISSGTGGSCRRNSQENKIPAVFGKDAKESADVVSSEFEDSNRCSSQEQASSLFDNERRDNADISSWTEDSCSSSSTTNTESDSSANTQDMSSASSDESLTKLVLKLNSMANTRCANSRNTSTSTTSNTRFLKYAESKQSCAAAALSGESMINVEREQIRATTTSNTESLKCVESNRSTTSITNTAASSTETIKCVKNKQSAIEAAPVENLERSIQNPSVSSSTLDRCPKIQIDFKTKFENAFMETEDESLQNPPAESAVEVESLQKSPAKSPLKSCLGKRPSPRKGNVSFPDDIGGDDSETEIKKPKLRSPESKD